MERPYDVITFDCYGTLIDWESGLTAAFISTAANDDVALERAAVSAAYTEQESQVEAEAYRSYRGVLAESARRAAQRLGWPVSDERAQFLPDSLPDWPAFPDTNPALERLVAAGYRLAILSNVDDDQLAGTLRHLTVSFDLLVTAEQARSYKPAAPHFDAARRFAAGRSWLHVAASLFHDVAPARALGVPIAWINRRGATAPENARPDREFPTLRELADWLTQSPSADPHA